MIYTKAQLIDGLKKQIANSDSQCQKALLEIYAYQTEDEQADGYTEEFNGVGFTGVDSEFLSSLAENLKKYGRLSEKQNSCLKKLMPKYAGQLLKISMSKGFIIKVKRGQYEIVGR